MQDHGQGRNVIGNAVAIIGTAEERAQRAQQLAQLAQLARLRAVEGGAEIGVGGWPGMGWDVHGPGMGGVSVNGAAGMVDVVGAATLASQVASLSVPSKAKFADFLRTMDPAALNMDAVQAASVLSRPLGLPPQSQVTLDVPGVARKQYIGLGSRVAIGAGLGVDIIAQPQSIARIERLLIESIGLPTASGRDFVVSRLDVGDARQISGQGEIPGLAFSADGFQLDVRLDTSNPGNTITISVENITAAGIVLALVGIGTVIR